MYLTPPSRLRDICRRGGRKIIKGRGGRCHQRNSIFQTQQDKYTHELTEAGTARTRPGTVQARWNPCTEKRKWTPRPTLTRKLLGKGCPWVYQPHSRECPRSGAVGQHRLRGFCECAFCLLFLSCFLFYFVYFF